MVTENRFENAFFEAGESGCSGCRVGTAHQHRDSDCRVGTAHQHGGSVFRQAPLKEKREDHSGKLFCLKLFGSLSGCLFLLLLSPVKVGAQTSPLVESATSSEVANPINQGEAQGGLSEAGFVAGSAHPAPATPSEVANPMSQGEAQVELSEAGFVVGSAHPTGVEGGWVADSLGRLDQMVVAQQTSGVQADAPMLPSSTDSADLQPVESFSAVEVISPPLLEPSDIAQAATAQPQSNQWHFLLVPYVYVPFFISGSANYEGSEDFQNNFSGNFDGSRDFEFTPTQIRTALKNSLNFAFLGGFEAWTPDYNLGILANFDYLSLTSDGILNRSVRRPGFADFVPTEINASLNTQVWNVDLAASYRFYDPAKANPQGLNTEYDLGPFVFDVLGGLNVTSLNTQLGLSTNLGGEGEFTTSDTVVSPLLGGRFRWNATPELAVLLSGSVSGFGIGGLTQYGVLGGVNWMFSGNTSVGLGYRFGFLDYDSGSSEVDLNVDQNGPYLNFGFRF